jgi:hypothetical protein
MEDITYALSREPMTQAALELLAWEFRMARLQLNTNADIEEVAIDGWLQRVTHENKSHMGELINARLVIYGRRVESFTRRPGQKIL